MSKTVNMEPVTRWSGLPRVIDPSLRNHRWILGLSTLAGLVGTLYQWFLADTSVLPGVLFGVATGIAAFLSWIIGRELDPDHPSSGLVAAVLVVPAILVLGEPALLAGFWLVASLRLLNRSTGLPAKPLDSIAFVLLTGWLAYSWQPAIGFLAGVVLLVDSWLPGSHPYHRWLGAFVLVGGAAYWAMTGDLFPERIEASVLFGALFISALFALAAFLQGAPDSVGDYTQEPLSVLRLRTAQIGSFLSGLLFIILAGKAGLVDLLPLWASLAGIAVYDLLIFLKS